MSLPLLCQNLLKSLLKILTLTDIESLVFFLNMRKELCQNHKMMRYACQYTERELDHIIHEQNGNGQIDCMIKLENYI